MKNKTLSLSRFKIDEKFPLQFSWCELVAKTTYFSSSTGKHLQVEGAALLTLTRRDGEARGRNPAL